VILAVKPHLVAGVLGNIASALAKDALVISIAAGISLDALREAARDRADIIRVMPNTPAQVGAGMAGVVPGPGVTDQQTEIALAIMSSVGQAVVVDEKQLDILGTVSGSGPAYLFLVAEAMIEGAVRLGLTRDLATKLVTQTLVGSAKLLAETGQHPAILREQVTSPGGTTAAALYELESAGIRAAFSAALEANLRRTHELG
jgi:pyrroline-5-carboxylate reductase